MFRKNVAGQFLYFALINATSGAALTGASVTGKRSIDGAAQGSVTGTISEDAGGQYHLALSQADSNGDDIGFLFTATNAIPVSITVVTTGDVMPANFPSLNITAGGAVAIQSGVKINTALNDFEFLMTDSTNHNPATGKTVAVTRSINNGAFAAGALSAVTEIGVGIYSVNFAASDLNGVVITLRATATGCDDTFITIVTDP